MSSPIASEPPSHGWSRTGRSARAAGMAGLLLAAAAAGALQAADPAAGPPGPPPPAAPGATGTTAIPAGYHLIYEQTFETPGALSQFVFTDPKAWRLGRTGPDTQVSHALELARQSDYQPAHRSPFNIALLDHHVLQDFILEADLIQTGEEYGHRDMCLFFGFQSPTNFYYVHLATAADDHAHNVFIVDGAPRTKIARQTTAGVSWGLGVWHKVRLERRGKEGTLLVFFDDLTKPIMRADNTKFTNGHVGFGSFDDTGMIDNIRIWAPSSRSAKLKPFVSGVAAPAAQPPKTAPPGAPPVR